jgi:hypothetical protein
MRPHYLALTCGVFARHISALAEQNPATVTVRLLEQGLHMRPKSLHEALQAQIDSVAPNIYDAILLVYGLCGQAVVGLTARHTPLVMPRAHDCVTLYLGSRERYISEFTAHPGTYWFSAGVVEQHGSSVGMGAGMALISESDYQDWINRFGEDNAQYLREMNEMWHRAYERAAFIETGMGSEVSGEQYAQSIANKYDWQYTKLKGNLRLLKMLLAGEWVSSEFLIVPPKQSISFTGDDQLIGNSA